MGEISGFQLGVIGALFLSVASSVSIVICNKALMSNLGFPFGAYSFSFNIIIDQAAYACSVVSMFELYYHKLSQETREYNTFYRKEYESDLFMLSS